MGVISKIFIGLGLLITIVSNFATYFGLRQAVNGMLVSAEEGIGTVVSGMQSAHFFSVVSLFGCSLLVIGLVLAALARKR